MILGVGAVVIVAWAARRDLRRWYEAQPVRVTREATGRVLHSQVALAQAVAVRPAVTDPLDRPTRTNPARGSARVAFQPVVFRVATGTYRGQLALARNIVQFKPSANVVIEPGTQARLNVAGRNGMVEEVLIQRPSVRYPVLLGWLAALLIAVIVLVRRRGLAFVAMFVATGLATGLVLLPAIAGGVAPAVAAGVYAVLLMGAFVALSGEVNRKAVAAIAGGVSGLLVAVVIAAIGSRLLKLSGYASTYAFLVESSLPDGGGISLVSLVQCGTVMCILGIVLDVGISVASGVEQVLVNNPNVPRREAIRAGLRMSRDIIGMMLLTLIFVWAGETLPVLLLARTTTVTGLELANSEELAVEVLRITAGGIGMLVAGPCAAALAGGLLSRPRPGRGSAAATEARPALWWAVCGLELAVCLIGVVSIARGPRTPSPLPSPDGRACPSDVAQRLSALRYHRDAELHTQQRCPNAAALCLWRALDMDPEHGPSRCDLAHLYAARRWFTLAHAEASHAVRLMPDDTKAHYVLGITSGWLEDYDAAEHHLREAVRLDPGNTAAVDALKQMFPGSNTPPPQ